MKPREYSRELIRTMTTKSPWMISENRPTSMFTLKQECPDIIIVCVLNIALFVHWVNKIERVWVSSIGVKVG